MSRLIPTRDAAIDAVLLAVLGVLALFALRNTYVGWSYLTVGGTGLAIGIVTAYALCALRQPVLVTAAATLVLFFAVGGVLAVPGGSPLRSGTYTTLAGSAVSGWKELLTTLPPVSNGDGLLVVPFILGLLGGAAGYTLAQGLPSPRRPDGVPAVLATVAPLGAPVAMLAAAIAFGTRQPGAEHVDGIAFAVLCLCWAAIRRSRVRPLSAAGGPGTARFVTAGGVLAAATAVALFGGPMLPGAATRTVLRDHVTPPFDIGAYPSPLVGFRKYSVDANDLYSQTLFTVAGLPAGATVRIASLDDYDGSVWGATSGTQGGSYERVGARFATPAGTETTLRVTIAPAYAGATDLNAWLPDAGLVDGVDFGGSRAPILGAALRFNRDASSGIVTTRLRAGDTYTLHTVLTTPVLPADAQPYGVPDLTDTAAALVGPHVATWTKSVTGLNAQLAAVAQYLSANGGFSDGGPNQTQYLPGHGLFRLTTFLNGPQPVGDDEQYAATYALVANYLGIPARVVFGATPETGGIVRGEDIHAWVEVHIADGSWVAIPQTQFMPPPGTPPKAQPPQAAGNINPTIVPPPNAARRPTTASDTGSNSPKTLTPPPPPSILARILAAVLAVAVWAGPPVLLVLFVAGGLMFYKSRRRRRRRGGPMANRFAGGWFELIDQARDAGIVVPACRTRQDEAAALADRDFAEAGPAGDGLAPAVAGSLVAPDRRASRTVPAETMPTETAADRGTVLTRRIRALADDADRAIYGGGEPTGEAAVAYWKRIDATRRDLVRHYGPWRRLRVALSTRSLRRPVRARSRAWGGTAS